jgi:hypothetical protein
MGATADLIDLDKHTLDTDTGLEWLDWSESINVDPVDVLTIFDGYRVATLDEWRVLAGNAGLTDSLTYSDSEFAAATMFYNLFNTARLACPRSKNFACGIIDQGTTNTIVNVGTFGDRGFSGAFPGTYTDEQIKDNFISDYGWLLVRNAFDVSEPGTLALLGLGLAGIGIARRRRIA